VTRNVVGAPASVKRRSAEALPSKWGTLYFPWSVGMRESSRGTHCRVSSSVDQMTCRTPAAFAAFAIAPASATSLSAERCAQKKVTQYAP
jgi:hypothetical protein